MKAYAQEIHVSSFSYFQTLYQSAGSKTIVLDDNIIFTDSLGNMGGDLYINGSGMYLGTDSGTKYSGFNLSAGQTLTLDDVSEIRGTNRAIRTSNSTVDILNGISFYNNTCNGNGGAIYNTDNSLINFEMSSGDKITFSSNMASSGYYGYGGAIYNYNSAMTFTNGDIMFIGNSAMGVYVSGGAIYNYNSTMTFQNCDIMFMGNSSAGTGGAIHNTDNSLINFEMSSGDKIAFSSNTANRGGAICNGSNSIVTFKNGDIMFIGNNAASEGGAIYSTSGQINFEMSSGNKIIFSSNTTDYYGGAICNISNSLINFEMSYGNKITFSSNTADYYGGAIYNYYNSAMTFTNGDIMFIENNAMMSGGAIYNSNNSTISFADSSITFSSNTADYYGGAIYNYNSAMTFTDGDIMFIENNAMMSGGAIYNTGNGNINFTNSDVIFSSNTADYYGGAIYNYNSAMTFTDGDITFDGNVATSLGGAIYNTGNGNINFTNSDVIFSSNTANRGGAIYNANNSFIDFASLKVNFINNTVGSSGGAVYNEGAIINFTDSFVKIENNKSTVTNSYIYSGAIYNTNSGNINFMDSDVIFSSNTALSGYGGAILNSGGSTMTFRNGDITFNGNVAWWGGAIYNTISLINFKMSAGDKITFSSNMAYIGGAIYNYDNSTMTFTDGDITFDGNVATSLGGVIYNANNSFIDFASLKVNFINNTVGSSGGAIYNDGAIINFTDSFVKFENNKSTVTNSYGGAIYNVNNSTITFRNGDITFDSNEGRLGGGAIYNTDNSLIDFVSSTISFVNNNNTTGSSGGAIYNYGAIINFTDSLVKFENNRRAIYNLNSLINFEMSSGDKIIFSSNTATYSGGAIVNGGGSTMTFRNGDIMFIGNNANTSSPGQGTDGGGAISNVGYSRINFEMSSGDKIIFSSNTALSGYGGAIFNSISSTTFRNGDITFNGNVAWWGGAIYNGGSQINFEMSSGDTITFSSNTAVSGYGGAIFNYFGSGITFRSGDLMFVGNTAVSGHGGAIYNYGYGSDLINFEMSSVDKITFSSNTAMRGGAIYSGVATMAFRNGEISFIKNMASISGGAIFNYNSTMTFTNGDVTFNGNVAASSGGAVFNSRNALIDFTSSAVNFVNNTAGSSGGAVYNDGAIINFTDSFVKFENNKSTGANIYGGAIYNTNSGNINFMDSDVIFSSNTARIYGGAIYNTDNSLINFEMSSGDKITFNSNTANRGGAIYNYDSTITFRNGNVMFIGNSTLDYTNSAGGAIYNSNSLINFEMSSGDKITFSSNTAGGYAPGSGGAIYNTSGSTITFRNGDITFSGNSIVSSGNGGAIYNLNSLIFFEMSSGDKIIFSSNTAYTGGAIYNDTYSTVTFQNGDIMFTENRAGAGGAIYNSNSLINFEMSSGDVIIFSNNTANLGGAIYNSYNSTITFTNGDMMFIGNSASNYGGAIYTRSAINFNALNSDMGIIFKENYANGQLNDIYLSGSSAVLNFNAIDGDIILKNGIRVDGDGSGITNKTGTGNLILGGTNEIWGDFNITGGDIIMLADATYEGKALELGNASALDMHNYTVNTVNVSGNFESKNNLIMDIFYDGSNDSITAATADLGGNIDIFVEVGTYDEQPFELIITGGVLTSTFTSSWISDNALNYELKYDGGIVKLILDGMSVTHFKELSKLTYNQKETAKTFDKISETPGAWRKILTVMRDKQNAGETEEIKDFLSQTSGYFLANVIRNMAADSPNNEVYDKIRGEDAEMQGGEENKTNSGLWVQMKGGVERFKSDENSSEDYKDASMGVMFGFDRFLAKKLSGGDVMWGIYGRINKDNIEQGKHKADGNKNGLGVYGGYIRDGWELKTMLLGSYDKFNTERVTYSGDIAKADISAMTISVDIEGALRIVLTEDVKLKPYAGIELANTMYGGFKERGADIYNLDVHGGSYLRNAARVGAGVDYEKEIWILYANVEGKYKIAGATSEIESKFENTGVNFQSRGTEEGKIEIGIGAGAEAAIAQNWKIFVNGKYYAGERYENLYGNAGIRYMFSDKKRLPNKEAEKKYNKAKKLYNKGEYLRATDMLAEMTASYPDIESSKRLHTKIQDEMNKIAAARQDADFSKITYAKGYCAYYQAEYNEALKEWRKYFEFAGANNEIKEYMDKVNSGLQLKKLVERETELETKANEMLNAGIEKYNASKWVECIKDMEALQKFVTESKFSGTEEYNNKAKEYITLSANELAKAMKTEKKKEIKPKEPEIKVVETKVEIDEAAAEKKYNEGLVLYAQGKYLEAERTWELTLRLNPNHKKAKIALSKIRTKDN